MKKIWTIIRVLVSFLLIALILSRVEIDRIADVLSTISLFLVLVLLAISFVMILISCLKWKLFLENDAGVVKLHVLMKYHLIGSFFNNLLPSTIGGDVARTYLLGKNINSQSRSFSSVLWERFTGMIALVVIGSVAVLFNKQLLGNSAIIVCVLLMSGSLAAAGLVFMWKKPKHLLEALILDRIKLSQSFRNKLDRLFASVYMVKFKKRELKKALVYSFLFQGMTIINTLVCCWAINLYPDPLDLAVTVPIVMMISAIPISIGGLGLWEGSFAFFFSLIGISPAEAVVVALILRGKNLLLGLIGGALLLSTGWKVPAGESYAPNSKPK